MATPLDEAIDRLTDIDKGVELDDQSRANQAFLVRLKATQFERKKFSDKHPNNKDEELYEKQNYIGNFTKALPHDSLGQVDPKAYSALLKALNSSKFADFEAIPLGGTAKLTDPQAAYAFELEGIDTHGLTIPPAPAFASAEEASEMAEVYWQALTRDVPFPKYDTDPLIQEATADLSTFSDFRGPKQGGKVTAKTLFRGDTPGDLAGPYLSQFLWASIPEGISGAFPGGKTPVPTTEQRRLFPLLDKDGLGKDYLTTFPEWLNIQNGVAPSESTKLDATPRYIHTSRDLAEFVHRDYPYLTFMNACLILLGYGPQALDPANPYLSAKTQIGFGTFGSSDVLDLVARVANEALKAAWFQKWLVHRRLRPEAFGGWIDNQKNNRASYPINSEILNSSVLKKVFDKYGSYLLPQAFPEGSPTHPAYPAGHAVYSGACITVLKTFFKEDFPIPNPVVASDDGLSLVPYKGSDTLTIGGELNKLAANIALGRDAAGVHWRSDGIEGLKLGEAVAIRLLEDRKTLDHEPFSGFSLTKLDNTTIVI